MENRFASSLFKGFQQGEQILNQPLREKATQLSLSKQEQGLRQGEAEQQRFLEDSNLKSIVQGSLQFSTIHPEDIQAQDAFIKNRAQ